MVSGIPFGINLDNLRPKTVDQSAKNIPRYDLAFRPGKVDEETLCGTACSKLLLLLLLLLSLLSQSLLVFFLRISQAQTMHLERQSLKSIILFIH